MRNWVIIFLITGTISGLYAQNPVLDKYIRVGLQANIELQQQKLSYLKSLSSVNEAKGLFSPGLTMNARYSVAQGGRTIDLPIRDIFNGYSAYNNMVNPEFHLITPEEFENQEIKFLRTTEHETKLSLAQPLFNTQLYFNLKIKKELSDADLKQMESATRRLIFDIRKTYVDYLKAVEVCKLLDETKVLSTEYVRVNELLFANGKVTSDAVYRARAEDKKVDQQMVEAKRAQQMAEAYFNAMLRQPLNSPIQLDERLDITCIISGPEEAGTLATNNREELKQLDLLNKASSLNVRMSSANRLPTVFAVADYGFQGENYRFNDRYDYLLASVVFRWELFRGFQNREKIHQAVLDKQRLENNRLDVAQKIQLEAIDSWYASQAAIQAHEAAEVEEEAMKHVFEMVKRKYIDGQASYLEYTEAQTSYTGSAINRILKKYDVYTTWFDLLRITASEDLKPYKTLLP
jgi:outer membrane protein